MRLDYVRQPCDCVYSVTLLFAMLRPTHGTATQPLRKRYADTARLHFIAPYPLLGTLYFVPLRLCCSHFANDLVKSRRTSVETRRAAVRRRADRTNPLYIDCAQTDICSDNIFIEIAIEIVCRWYGERQPGDNVAMNYACYMLARFGLHEFFKLAHFPGNSARNRANANGLGVERATRDFCRRNFPSRISPRTIVSRETFGEKLPPDWDLLCTPFFC